MPALRSFLHVQFPSVAVFVLAMAATAMVTQQLAHTIRLKDEERFRAATDRLESQVVARIDLYVAMLRAGVALFDVQPGVTGEQFREFVARLELGQRYPGIQGVGFTTRVLPQDVPGIEAARRAAGNPAFQIWPDYPRDEYHAIVYLEPLDLRNRQAIGFDMYTEPTRQQAMARARDTGEPAASGPVTLVQEQIPGSEVQAGFLIYVPVYRGGTVPPTVAERRERLMGFVYSPFRTGDLFTGIFGREQPRAGFQLFDVGGPREPLYQSDARGAPWFSDERQIHVAGRPWTLSIFSLPALEAGSNAGLVPVVWWTGLAVSLLLAGLVGLQAHARQRLQQQADALSALYAQVQQLLASERSARSEAERASRLKDEFLATLSHELRTPLNAVQGWAHVLTMAGMTPEKRGQAVSAILRGAQAQARLIDDLLDMSRISSGRVRLDRNDVDLTEVLDASIGAVRPTADAQGVRVHAALPEEPVMVHADTSRLQQVFSNLLSNAVSFTPTGGDVTVTAEVGDGEVRVVVRDTGRGIEPAFLPYVFERFRQSDGSITRRHGGLGLGLSIARSLVLMHGGRITADSPGPGQGATFTVTLPLAAASAEAARPAARELVSVALEPDVLAGLVVLVVDDDADARVFMHDVLAAYGARVVLAGSAADALDILRDGSERIDVLVSDIGMPDMDGYALVEALRRLPGERGTIPAVAVTAYAAAEDVARARAAGYRLHVSKPVTPHDVAAACAVAGDRVTVS